MRLAGHPDAFGMLPSTDLLVDIVTPGDGQLKALALLGANPVSREPRTAPAGQATGVGERGLAPGRRLSVPGEPVPEIVLPVVRDLAGDGIPGTVTCRVLRLCRQQYYRWLAEPVTDAELDEAYRPTRCSTRIATIPSTGIGSLPM